MSDHLPDIGPTAPFNGASPWLFAVREEFMDETPRVLQKLKVMDLDIEVLKGKQSLWITVRWPSGAGVLLRTAYAPEGSFSIDDIRHNKGMVDCYISSSIGRFHVHLDVLNEAKTLLHWTVWLTPSGGLNFPFWPADVYPIDGNYDPLGARGVVHAGQRGPAAGLLFFTVTKPEGGSVLYLQNLTALNEYCELTHTAPKTRVGGSWPELGYTLPISERKPIPAGHELIISDAYVRFTHVCPTDSADVSLTFMDTLSEIYQYLPKPGASYQHWLERAQRTVYDLSHSDACATNLDGRKYLSAYVGTSNRRPESLVQLAVLLPLLEYEDWTGKKIPLIGKLKDNLASFYDDEVKCVMRYPKSTRDEDGEHTDEKGYYEMDSWYLYHPLMNLARMALRGDRDARRLFMDSLEYAIEVAHRFDYKWPVLFNAQTFEVMREAPTPEMGETDVGGLYAYVMLQARELTGDDRYLEEAIHGVKSLEGLHFNVGYQFNNTAWSAIALIRLWRITGDDRYRRLSFVCISSIFQNTFLWDCDYGFAKHYTTFFGLTPLREGDYIALYEESEVFAAFEEYLAQGGYHIPNSLRLMLSEFAKYCLDGKYCFYPSDLPEEVISKEPQNGFIDRRLAIPLEDVYQGWEPAGQVGQEVYGAGAALTFVSRAYQHIKGSGFLLWCQYPVDDVKVEEEGKRISFATRGSSDLGCAMRLIPKGNRPVPEVKVTVQSEGSEEERTGLPTDEGHLEFFVLGDSRITIELVSPKETKGRRVSLGAAEGRAK